jgi:hypothetical protein
MSENKWHSIHWNYNSHEYNVIWRNTGCEDDGISHNNEHAVDVHAHKAAHGRRRITKSMPVDTNTYLCLM